MSRRHPAISLLSSMTESERRDFVASTWNRVQGNDVPDAKQSIASRRLMDLFADSLIHTDNMLSTVSGSS